MHEIVAHPELRLPLEYRNPKRDCCACSYIGVRFPADGPLRVVVPPDIQGLRMHRMAESMGRYFGNEVIADAVLSARPEATLCTPVETCDE